MATTYAEDASAVLEPKQQVQGGVFTPLPDGEKDGIVETHAFQTINADAESLYKLWHEVTLFPRWQENVVSVTPTGAKTTHWVMGNPEDPDGKRMEFDSEIAIDLPGKQIGWHSIGGDVVQSGIVTFEPLGNGRGTLVSLQQRLKVPGGALGNAAAAVAKRSPAQTVKENLRHFKQMAEAGEIPSVEGQPHGPRGVSGGIKEFLYGETNPTPPGTSSK
jgi:uncharacterized membrane protein